MVFHSYLNRLIEVNHPKQALFVDKIMQITKMNYDKYIYKIVSENINWVNIYKECYKYFLAYLKEYKKALDFTDFLKNCN